MIYHNILSIGRDQQSGKLFLDCFFQYTNEEAEKYKLKLEVQKNELWKTTDKEASEISGCEKDMHHVFHGIEIRARYNNFSVCHFTTEVKTYREDFESLVACANFDKSTLQKINDAIIIGHKFS